MSEAVTVAGTPTLSLNDGGTATYIGGSGTSALTFSYTVSASDTAVSSAGNHPSQRAEWCNDYRCNGNNANFASAVTIVFWPADLFTVRSNADLDGGFTLERRP